MTASRHDSPHHIEPQRGWLPHPFRAPRALRRWLSDRGSLTRRLTARHADFRVIPVARGFTPPFLDEAQAIHLRPKTHAYARDVLLAGGGRTRVFAHSVLPRASLRGGWHGITRLGSRPLGEALFTDPRIYIGLPVVYDRLRLHHLIQAIIAITAFTMNEIISAISNGDSPLVPAIFSMRSFLTSCSNAQLVRTSSPLSS